MACPCQKRRRPMVGRVVPAATRSTGRDAVVAAGAAQWGTTCDDDTTYRSLLKAPAPPRRAAAVSSRRRSSGRRPPPVDRGSCPATGKRRLLAHEARRVAEDYRRRNPHERTVPYRCRACDAWHVGHDETNPAAPPEDVAAPGS